MFFQQNLYTKLLFHCRATSMFLNVKYMDPSTLHQQSHDILVTNVAKFIGIMMLWSLLGTKLYSAVHIQWFQR
jgi:hypothetical protein